MDSIGNRLSLYRKKARLSQSDVSETLNISRQAISSWENERSYPDIDNLIKLSELYNVSLDTLLKNENIQPNNNSFIQNNAEKIGLFAFIALSIAIAPFGLILLPIVFIKYKNNINIKINWYFYVLVTISLAQNIYILLSWLNSHYVYFKPFLDKLFK